MRSLSTATIAALNAPVLGIAVLVYMQFPGFPVALCSANFDIDFGGVLYRGAAGLGTISPVDDSPGEIKGIQLGISGVLVEYISLALDDADIVQGSPLTIRLAIMNADGLVLDADVMWIGRLDTMTIQEDGETCSIAVTAESVAVDLLRGSALTTSNADQRSLYPGDRAFEYVVSQANTPIVWPTKQLFMAMR